MVPKTTATTAAPAVTRDRMAGPLRYPTSPTRIQVLNAISNAADGGAGLTDDEMMAKTGLQHQAAGGRRGELVRDGWVVNAGIRRESARSKELREADPDRTTKQYAIVWFLSKKGAEQLGIPCGWKAKRKKKPPKPPPKDETLEERRIRREKEAIREAEEEHKERLGAAAEFRREGEYWKRWAGKFGDLADLAEEEPCPPSTRDWLLVVLEGVLKEAERAQTALLTVVVKDASYYTMLGVKPTATAKQIKDAFSGLAKRYHPDTRAGDPASEDPRADEKYAILTNIYNTLKDPKKRAAYDLKGTGE